MLAVDDGFSSSCECSTGDGGCEYHGLGGVYYKYLYSLVRQVTLDWGRNICYYLTTW